MASLTVGGVLSGAGLSAYPSLPSRPATRDRLAMIVTGTPHVPGRGSTPATCAHGRPAPSGSRGVSARFFGSAVVSASAARRQYRLKARKGAAIRRASRLLALPRRPIRAGRAAPRLDIGARAKGLTTGVTGQAHRAGAPPLGCSRNMGNRKTKCYFRVTHKPSHPETLELPTPTTNNHVHALPPPRSGLSVVWSAPIYRGVRHQP